MQRGPNIVVHFTMSAMTTEAMPIKDAPEVDLRVGVTARQFQLQAWLDRARRIPVQKKNTDFLVPAADFVGKDVVIAVRLVNDRGKDAGWSNFVPLLVTAPVPRPENLQAVATAPGVQLTWSGAAAPVYRIYRKGETGDFGPLGSTPNATYVDTTAEFGKTYTYFVQGVQKQETSTSESELSDEVTITPKDIFPPSIPMNLKAIVGTRSVELSWDRDTESDLGGYRVFRGAGNRPLEPLAGKLVGVNYSDRAVPSGHYRYAVSAYDLTGNESERSPAIEVDVP